MLSCIFELNRYKMLRSIVFTIFLGIVLFTADYISLGQYIHPKKWSILAFFLALALLQHRLMEFGFRENRKKFVQFYLSSLTARFVMCLIFVGVFLYLKVEDPNGFVLTFFAFYLFYTCFEIYGLYRNLRRDLEE